MAPKRRKKYEAPALELFVFSSRDTIASSNISGEDEIPDIKLFSFDRNDEHRYGVPNPFLEGDPFGRY